MKVKVFIAIIEHLNSALFLGLVFCVIVVASNAKDGELLVFEALIMFPFIIAFAFRLSFINLYLKKCKYPVPFLSVMQKLGLLKEMDINWSDEAQKDLNKPTYSTETFLLENKLIGNIKNKDENFSTEVLQFNTHHIQINNSQLLWQSILDWDFIPGDEHTTHKIIIYHYNEEGSNETFIDLDSFSASKVDILLLLAHYKGKYG